MATKVRNVDILNALYAFGVQLPAHVDTVGNQHGEFMKRLADLGVNADQFAQAEKLAGWDGNPDNLGDLVGGPLQLDEGQVNNAFTNFKSLRDTGQLPTPPPAPVSPPVTLPPQATGQFALSPPAPTGQPPRPAAPAPAPKPAVPGGVTMGTTTSRATPGVAAPSTVAKPAPAKAPAAAPRAAVASPAAVDTTPKLAPNASQADALQFIREHYGYGAWIFEHPDVAGVLTAAAKDGHWSDARLQGALGATDFFKQNTGTTIAWMNTETNDPATAKSLVDQEVNTVTTKAQAIGLDLDPDRARQIATDAKRFGWDDTQLTQAVGHEYHYNPTMAQKGIAKQITDTARLYGVPMTDAGLDEWGRKVASGDATADDFKVTMINQAKSLFPTLAADLDRGATVKDIFDPYAKLAATTLGVDANTIDILDPKWQRPLQSSDGKNPTRMSTYDWSKTLRTDATYGWDTTDNARQEAAGFAHKIREGFGLA